jgi:Holliday junction DNA helicase RuvA
MLSYLKGIVLYKGADFAIIDVENLGFRVYLPEKILEGLKIGDTGTFFTYEHLREDRRELYGFLTASDLEFFFSLLQVQGIGPRMAQKILSHAAASEVAKAIEAEDLEFLTKVSRIGRKTAEKLILELKGKLVREAPRHKDPDLEEALKRLGYSSEEINHALKDIASNGEETTEQKLKSALKVLKK